MQIGVCCVGEAYFLLENLHTYLHSKLLFGMAQYLRSCVGVF